MLDAEEEPEVSKGGGRKCWMEVVKDKEAATVEAFVVGILFPGNSVW